MRSARLACLVAAACVPFLLAPVASHGAVDYFLDLEGIEGESNAQGFENQIDVESYSWGVTHEPGKAAVFQDLTVTKRVDSSSPALLVRAASGQTIPTAELTARKSGAEQFVFLTFCLTGVQVTGVQSSGEPGDSVPAETVKFAYSKITEVYRPQNPDGSAGQPIVGGWDLVRRMQTGAVC